MKMARLFAALIFSGMFLEPARVHAAIQNDIDAAKSQIRTDSALLSQWLSDQFKMAVPYSATSGNVVPSQLKVFGFEVGAQIVGTGTKLDTDGLDRLGTSVIDSRQIDVPDRLPFPMVLGHAKIGLPFGLDAGIRLGGIPETEKEDDDTRIKIKNKVVGIDVRKALIEEGVTRPFGVTLGINYTHADGQIDFTTPYDYKAQIVENGTTYNTNSQANTRAVSKWKTDSVGLQALMHKKIAFFNPYLGASVNRNSGDVDTAITTTGNLTITDASNAANTLTQDIGTLSGTGTAAAEKWDVRGLLGAEFSFLPFMRLGLGLDFAGSRKIGASLGLRVQFR